MTTALVSDFSLVSNCNLGSTASAEHPDHHLLKVQEERTQESRDRGHFGLVGSLRLSRNARAGCNSSYGDRQSEPLRMASATKHLSRGVRHWTNNARCLSKGAKEFVLRFVPGRLSVIVRIMKSVPCLRTARLGFEA